MENKNNLLFLINILLLRLDAVFLVSDDVTFRMTV